MDESQGSQSAEKLPVRAIEYVPAAKPVNRTPCQELGELKLPPEHDVACVVFAAVIPAG